MFQFLLPLIAGHIQQNTAIQEQKNAQGAANAKQRLSSLMSAGTKTPALEQALLSQYLPKQKDEFEYSSIIKNLFGKTGGNFYG